MVRSPRSIYTYKERQDLATTHKYKLVGEFGVEVVVEGNLFELSGDDVDVREEFNPLISSLKARIVFFSEVKIQQGPYPHSTFDVFQMFGFFLQMGFTLILATLAGLDVGLLADFIGGDDCDDDE
ncbi:hypothetical protein Tco_1317218 [Tanacetum coccineum]